ncbi:FAD-dependent oxidoreductase [Roseomonas sp. CECT 9278]|uniref:hydroxysqualene dehydroxylase n=1 Tax=Roseomonas sp. CECT 9278 TaxID=2845823 RepID=UPI001E4B5944|nr:FAD-dependent oxidoreductase [Roseomonas sp. CECT 9278]CAH0308804.1 Hydroxysqualene dehydroxylase [Roseomonas sp. CECT 9278]
MTAQANAAAQVHVVGAGVAGLVAALAVARAGHAVTLHEATPAAGGRCRALPDGTDNGTHALMGANHAALRFLDAIGARAGWVEPEPDGLPMLDLADGNARRIAAAPLAWRDPARRPPGMTAGAFLALARMALGITDRPVGMALAKHPVLLRGFVEPLTVAALNTPVAEASSARLGQVLRRLGSAEASRLLVARTGLGPDLVDPALAALRAAGATIRFGSRLRALTSAEGRASALHLAEHTVALDAADAVILALPPWEAARLIPGLRVPERHAPILNLHFARQGEGPVRFLGVVGGLTQWVLVRPAGVSVTVSAADAETEADMAVLAPRAWAEIRQAAAAFGLPGAWPEAPPPCRAVKERRATPRHGVGIAPVAPRMVMRNLALAGDWTWSGLPATIDAAARSGEAAAKAIAARLGRTSPRAAKLRAASA